MARNTRKAFIARNSEYCLFFFFFFFFFTLEVSNSCSFGFEDEISQPQIDGLDPDPKEDEQRAIPPG